MGSGSTATEEMMRKKKNKSRAGARRSQ